MMIIRTRLAVLALLVASAVPSMAAPTAAELMAQGDHFWEQGKLDDARKRFEQAVTSDPASVDARMKLGGILLSGGHYDDAILNYQQVLSRDHDNARAWMGLGFCYLHSGKKELSRAAFGEAVRSEPSRKAQLANLMQEPAQ